MKKIPMSPSIWKDILMGSVYILESVYLNVWSQCKKFNLTYCKRAINLMELLAVRKMK